MTRGGPSIFSLTRGSYDQQKVLLRFYDPLSRIAQASGRAVDVVDPTSSVDLTRYKLLVAPGLNVIDEPLAAKLLAYVRQGGHLLLGPRSGMKDAFNSLNPQRQPGPLAEALGAKVDQYYALSKPVSLTGDMGKGTGDVWAEALTVPATGHLDLQYIDPAGWLDHQPAMVSASAGAGKPLVPRHSRGRRSDGTYPQCRGGEGSRCGRGRASRARGRARGPGSSGRVAGLHPDQPQHLLDAGSSPWPLPIVGGRREADTRQSFSRWRFCVARFHYGGPTGPRHRGSDTGARIMISRRRFVHSAVASSALAAMPAALATIDPAAPYETPYKYPTLLLGPTHRAGDFDERSVDDPIVFRANGVFQMLYIGFDGTGYQTGLATSQDLIHWTRKALVGPRNAASTYTRFNLAISSILRDKNLHGTGEALQVDGHYLAAWNAYPSSGYEEGAAVIGLARSTDLLHWTLTDPILTPQEGAPWEHGGLYRPDLALFDGTYYLYYNAKTDSLPKTEGGGWHEQTGVATSKDLKTWTRFPLNPILRNGLRGSTTYPAGVNVNVRIPAQPDARDSRFASNPYVMKNGREYAMFYFGFGYQRPGRACELLAVGADPLHFTKVAAPLIDTGAPGSIDETFAHKPSVIYHQGALYHFYCAVSGKYPDEVRGIAVARSKPF